MHDTVSGLARKYDFTYHDYNDDPRFADADFSDGDHLACAGARKFSLILSNDIAALPSAKSSTATASIPLKPRS